MFRAPSNVEILGDQAETSITLYLGLLPQLKPKDTLLITTSDISKVNTVQLTSQTVTFEGIKTFLWSLASEKKHCLGGKSLKQAYSAIVFPSRESITS
jgi:hypothetical protein